MVSSLHLGCLLWLSCDGQRIIPFRDLAFNRPVVRIQLAGLIYLLSKFLHHSHHARLDVRSLAKVEMQGQVQAAAHFLGRAPDPENLAVASRLLGRHGLALSNSANASSLILPTRIYDLGACGLTQLPVDSLR